MGEFSIWHWLVVLAIVIVVFGTKRLRNVAGDLGAAVKGFRAAVKDDSASETAPQPVIPGVAEVVEAQEKKD